MTTEPVILPPDATVAEALAQHPQRRAARPSLAAMVYVCRPPLETPDRPARSASPTSSGCCASRRRRWSRPSLDNDIEPLRAEAPLDEVTRHLADYNLVASPVVDDDGRLLGAVTVDDVLDHLLPENWRERPSGAPSRRAEAVADGA